MGQKALQYQDYSTYLALEKEADLKYEFHDGFIVAMAGGTLAHGQIAANFTIAAGNQLRESDCTVYSSDVKVRIESTHHTFYPDVSVVCGTPRTSDQDAHALINPILIVEVLSESTEGYDRGGKFAHYRQLASFREYVLVSQTEVFVDVYFTEGTGTWEINSYTSLEDVIHLKSIDARISLADIYRKVSGLESSSLQ